MPNAEHIAVTPTEERLSDRFLLVAESLDGFHHCAESKKSGGGEPYSPWQSFPPLLSRPA